MGTASGRGEVESGERTAERGGGSGDRTPDDPAAEEEEQDDGPVWHETDAGRIVVSVYVLGTVAAVFVAVNDIGHLPLVSSTGGSGVYPVPGYVFLYAYMGASAYAVTSLLDDGKTTEDVIKLGLRVVGALPLAVGVWALAPLVGFGGEERAIAGAAFLAGLYVNLALKTFGGIAERLLQTPGS